MAGTDEERNQPKTILWHSSNVSDFLKQQLGMINANSLYNNFFLEASECNKFVNQVIELIKSNVVDIRKKPELRLNQDALTKLDKIYNGGCFLVKHYKDDHYHIDSWTFHYEYPDGAPQEDVQPLPPLKALNPTKTIDSDDWGITIRQAVEFKFAFAVINISTVFSVLSVL